MEDRLLGPADIESIEGLPFLGRFEMPIGAVVAAAPGGME